MMCVCVYVQECVYEYAGAYEMGGGESMYVVGVCLCDLK